MTWLCLKLTGAVLVCVVTLGCFPAKETLAADLGGLRNLSVHGEVTIVDVAEAPQVDPPACSKVRLAIAKVRRPTGREHDQSPPMVTLGPSDDERRTVRVVERDLGGTESAPIAAFVEPGLVVTAEALRSEARQMGAKTILVYTYWSKQETDTWSVPFVFTLGLAPVLNSSYQARVEAIAVDVASGAVVFDGTDADEGWQIANGYTRPEAEGQVSRRVECRAFARIMDRYIAATGGRANPPLQEPMTSPW